jgi:hypothetical protein
MVLYNFAGKKISVATPDLLKREIGVRKTRGKKT